MGETPGNGGKQGGAHRPQVFTERQVSEAFGLDRLQLYLVSADLRVGRYDALTHLKVFTAAEVARIAARLNLPVPDFSEKVKESESAPLENVPEPSGE